MVPRFRGSEKMKVDFPVAGNTTSLVRFIEPPAEGNSCSMTYDGSLVKYTVIFVSGETLVELGSGLKSTAS